MKVAILTSKESWFRPYAEKLAKTLQARCFFNHEDLPQSDILFILSYFMVMPQQYLERCKRSVVVHESDLPMGRGWTPLFWQILEGRNVIPIVLFEATKEIDAGDIWIKDYIVLSGDELSTEIRQKQAEKTIELCLNYLKNYKNLTPRSQKGKPTFYRRRTPKDSELDINRDIKEQFNLLRIVDNKEYPAFFFYKGHKYIIHISKGGQDERKHKLIKKGE